MRVFWSREWLGGPKRRTAGSLIARLLAVTIVASALTPMIVLANEGFGEGGNNSSGYQRKSRNAVVRHDIRKRDRVSRFASPQVSAGWFQRPYPYHLDYYRMRYGGSYAPYFGNLYGPPNVVLAQPYYGYGYDGYYGPDGGGYPYPGPVSPNMEVNPGAYPAESGMGELVEPALPGR